jgi:hypothetical protein
VYSSVCKTKCRTSEIKFHNPSCIYVKIVKNKPLAVLCLSYYHLWVVYNWAVRYWVITAQGKWCWFISFENCYLLTPRCRVLLEKLNGLQLVKKFHAFHGTRKFITALISVRHLSLSWASPIQSIYPHPTSWRSVLILSTHLRLGLPIGFFPSGFHTENCWKVKQLSSFLFRLYLYFDKLW